MPTATVRRPLPFLRLRPVAPVTTPPLPSPLARRGAAERAYLQGQLWAEARRRRTQEQHDPNVPAVLLKKKFECSVSAVLADSGIDEDGSLLFFPDGVPLLDEDDMALRGFSNDTVSGTALDYDSSSGSDDCASPGPGGDATFHGSHAWQVPSFLDAVDVVRQRGTANVPMPAIKGGRKVALRPRS